MGAKKDFIYLCQFVRPNRCIQIHLNISHFNSKIKIMFLLHFLFLFISSEYIELNKENVDTYIGAAIPIFVKFYSPQCGHCQAMAEDFSEASTYFQKDVLFGGVDCLAQHEICEVHKVEGYPTIKLFKKNDKEGTEYSGDRSTDEFVSYVQTNTGAKTHKQLSVLVNLNPYNYEKKINAQKCAFVMFYANWDQSSKHFLPQLKEIANVFDPEPNVTVGAVNCENYNELCQNNSITDYPTFVLMRNTQKVPFTGEQTIKNVITMINANCGTQRDTNGLLRDDVGLVKDAKPVVEEFKSALDQNDDEKKNAAIEKMKAIPGTEIYVKAMERLISKGKEVLSKDLVIMNDFMTEKKGSIKALDGMKRRYNVFKLFVPTPAPKPAADEQESKGNDL